MVDAWAMERNFARKREGDDLDRFADLVSLVALVRLVELGGRKDGTTEGRKDGEGRNYGRMERRRGGTRGRKDGETERGGTTEGRNYGEGETG